MIELKQGDCLTLLPQLPEASVDAIITDPPYASGGLHSASRLQPPSSKYLKRAQRHNFPEFSGDQMDQRSWTLWCAQWLSECARVLKPGGLFVSFIDWRQQPSLSTAVQWAGLIWQGVAVWDKNSARPRNGGYRQQAEFIVWASKGIPLRSGRYGPGVFRASIAVADKQHMTQKPVSILTELMQPLSEDAVILDPFMGSGSTAIACLETGRHFIGMEREPTYFAIAEQRVAIAITAAK